MPGPAENLPDPTTDRDWETPRKPEIRQTLNLKWMTSPSRTTYSLPSSCELGVRAAGGLGAELDEVLPPDDLGLDEAALEVGVDDARRLGRLGAALDGPGAALVGAGREERDEVEDLVRRARDGVQAGLLQAEALEERGAIGGVEAGDLRLGGRADHDDGRALGLGVRAQRA